MLGQKEDKEKAIEWYYRAAVAFQKSGHQDDARTVIRHLQSQTAKHPTVLGLVAKFEKLVAGQDGVVDRKGPTGSPATKRE